MVVMEEIVEVVEEDMGNLPEEEIIMAVGEDIMLPEEIIMVVGLDMVQEENIM
nr:MAG TPA: hypothetical protein [Caudoviricetes sp.]